MSENNTICKKCGAKFGCDITAGKEQCWCFEMPKLLSSSKADSCLCPKCLKEAISAQEDKQS